MEEIKKIKRTKTKIIATLGPSTEKYEIIDQRGSIFTIREKTE